MQARKTETRTSRPIRPALTQQTNGKTIGQLSKIHDRMVSEGRAPKVQAVPVKVGGLTKPVWQQKEEEEEKKHKIGFHNMQGRGVKIGTDKPRANSHVMNAKPEPMRFSKCKKPTGAAANHKLDAHRAKM